MATPRRRGSARSMARARVVETPNAYPRKYSAPAAIIRATSDAARTSPIPAISRT